MKAICIRDTTFALRNGVYDRASKVMSLTIGREYPKAFFITLEEYRNQKLEKLGI